MVSERTITVLLVEDDEDDHILVRDMLAEVSKTHYQLHWVNSYATGLEAIRSRRYDVCLLDYQLQEQDGIGFLYALSGREHVPPIIFLTGMADYDVDLEAMRAGAADYLEKRRVNSHILERAIRYAIERQAAQKRLQQQSAILEGINRVLRGALKSDTEEELGRTSLAVVQELTGAGGGFMEELEAEGGLQVIAGSDPAPDISHPDPRIQGLCDQVIREGVSLVDNHPGAAPQESGPPAGPGGLSSFLGIPLQYSQKVIGLICLVNKAGGFDAADQEVAETLALAIVEALMRFRAERKARSTGRLYRLLSMLNEAIVRVRERTVLFQEVCRIAVEEGMFRLAWIGLADPRGRSIEVAAQCCFEEKCLPPLAGSLEDLPENYNLTSLAIREGRYKVCNDLAADPGMVSWRETARDLGLRAGAAFPLQVESKTVGALTLYADRPGFFTAEELSLLESLAENLSFALESLHQETRRRQAEDALLESREKLRSLTSQLMTAQETERKRIALELHDDLGQSLSFLKLQLRDIENHLPPDLWELKKCSTDLRNYINEVIEKVRRISRDLTPSILIDLGLPTALKNLVEEFCKFHDCDLSMEVDDIQNAFSPEEEISIYRMFQESLNNIAKHAQADQIGITVKINQNHLNFQVEDNGRGFDAQQLANGEERQGMGLASLNERVRMLGGAFKIWSRPGRGTKLSFVIPLRNRT